MTAFVCPYCYSRVNDRDLLFVCSGRASPRGVSCPMEVDEARRVMTGYYGEYHKVFKSPSPLFRTMRAAECPSCGAETGIRACPSCHTPLPTALGASKALLICLAGAKGAGKSVYLTVLAHRMRLQLGRKFNASVTSVSPGLHDDWLRGYDDLFTKLRLPPATSSALAGKREPLVFHWRSQPSSLLRRYSDCFMSYYDTAGEDFSTIESVHLLEYLAAGNGLILLIDPLTIPQARDQIRHSRLDFYTDVRPIDIISRITEVLRSVTAPRRNGLIKIPVAVVLTKFDLLFDVLGADHPLMFEPSEADTYDDTAGAETHLLVRNLLMEWGADDLDRHLQLNFAEYRYFAISSLGSRPDSETASVNEEGVHPFRVDEPVTWLLSRFGIIGKTGKGGT